MAIWLERQRNILDFAISSLTRRKRKILALGFVYTLVVFLLASVLFLTSALKREAALVLRDAPEMIVQKISAGRHDPIPLSALESIKDLPGVESARGRLWGYYYDSVVGANYTIVVPETASPEPGAIEIGAGVARVRSLLAGDTMEFRSFRGELLEWTVGGILSPESELLSSDLVVLSESDFRTLFGGPEDRVTDLIVRVRNERELPTIAQKIAESLPDARIVLRDEILRTYEAVFSWRGGILIVILAGAALAFMILAWDKASGLSPEEKREIGILKAVGWETSDVLVLKFWEGMVISLTSFLVGMFFAYVHTFFASAALFAPILKGWGVLFPRFRLIPALDAPLIIALFFLTVVPYIVATIIPSWRASIVDPDSVMR